MTTSYLSVLHRIRTLVIKELQILLSDSSGRRIIILPVILQIVLFPLAATLEVKNNTLGIYNEDSGAISIELMQRLASSKAFTSFRMIHSEAELKDTIEAQRALLVVRFPPNFSKQFETGKTAPLSIILDGRRSNGGQIAYGYIGQIVDTYVTDYNTAHHQRVISKLVVRNWFNANLDFVYFILPSLIANILTIGSLIITSLSVAREREQGTFDQLLVSPLTPEMIMIGKAVPSMIVGSFQATLVLIAAIFIYQIPFQGSLFLFYVSMLVYVISLVGFGLLISSICTTQQQAFLGTFSFLMPAVLLSGYTSPIDNMPFWLQCVTWFNPLRHFMEISRGIFLKNMELSTVAENVMPLIVIAVITLGASVWIFRRRIS